jgi:hypothetical protein
MGEMYDMAEDNAILKEMKRQPSRRKPLHTVKDLNIDKTDDDWNVYAELLLWPDGTVTWCYKNSRRP